MDEEKKDKAPCIQDRFRAITRKIPWPLINIIFILISITYIYLDSPSKGHKFTPMETISILLVLPTIYFAYNQTLINTALFRIERQRNQPFLYAEISHERYNGEEPKKILIENRGEGIAWGCKVTLSRGDIDKFFEEFFEEIYPWSGEEIEIPKVWHGQSFDLCIEIDYHIGKYHSGDSRHWERVFRDIAPF